MIELKKELPQIPPEKFRFVPEEGRMHDQKLETKPIGYFKDAMIRFSKNKGSVVAAWIILILVLPALLHGRRAACHYLCWMAPFMVIGSTAGRLLRLPQIHIEADREKCVSCGRCVRACPMGLDVSRMAAEGSHASCTECIQCGACEDACPQHIEIRDNLVKIAEIFE